MGENPFYGCPACKGDLSLLADALPIQEAR